MSSIVKLVKKKVISSSHVLQIPPLRAYREISGLLSQSVPLAAYIILSFQKLTRSLWTFLRNFPQMITVKSFYISDFSKQQ